MLRRRRECRGGDDPVNLVCPRLVDFFNPTPLRVGFLQLMFEAKPNAVTTSFIVLPELDFKQSSVRARQCSDWSSFEI
jgi:hypothetical protein